MTVFTTEAPHALKVILELKMSLLAFIHGLLFFFL